MTTATIGIGPDAHHRDQLHRRIPVGGIRVRFIGDGPILAELRAGFTTFFADPLVVPALIIGVLYACLYMFGTGIYLDHRENTYCIPLNRCSSLLSGVVASFGLTWLLGWKPPSGYRHLITRPLAVPADIQRGDAVAVNKPSMLYDALSVRTTQGPRFPRRRQASFCTSRLSRRR
jgi:hypothetical protein